MLVIVLVVFMWLKSVVGITLRIFRVKTLIVSDFLSGLWTYDSYCMFLLFLSCPLGSFSYLFHLFSAFREFLATFRGGCFTSVGVKEISNDGHWGTDDGKNLNSKYLYVCCQWTYDFEIDCKITAYWKYAFVFVRFSSFLFRKFRLFSFISRGYTSRKPRDSHRVAFLK